MNSKRGGTDKELKDYDMMNLVTIPNYFSNQNNGSGAFEIILIIDSQQK